jgi:hypothetical protein
MSVCIGLFGTCGNSKWRDSFVANYKQLNIEFYNPQVADWKPEDAEIEAEHLVNDNIILFPVTSETYGTGSLAETGFSILSAIKSNGERNIITFIDKTVDQHLIDDNPTAAKESVRARALVRAHLMKVNYPFVYMVDDLGSMLALSMELYKIAVMMEDIKSRYKR